MATFKATGKDTYTCRKELKFDGFTFGGSAWYGNEAAVAKFKARGYKAKVSFVEVQNDEVTQDGGQSELMS